MFKKVSAGEKLKCTHCGDECPEEHPIIDGRHFCCNGCEVVYSLLTENGMGAYYNFEENPGISRRSALRKNFDFLDAPDVVEKLLVFREGRIAKIILKLPQIHCSSCIWLLENLSRLNEYILHSRVDFVKQEATITFDIEGISLKKLAELLSLIGYEPELNFQKLEESKSLTRDRTLLYKLGLAGFSFGNIMLLSFPEYLGFAEADFRFYLGYINILLAIPVLLYSGMDYLRSAFFALKYRQINLNVPIAIGMLTLFFRSSYEIISHTGEGYMDSLAGFVFFLLIGKWFQQYTFSAISFDRDFRSYFPISAHLKSGEQWTTVTLDKLKSGDIISVRNEEIIPADGIILQGDARVDYSFVTGESDPVVKNKGDKVFAGGKHLGPAVEILLTKSVDQSYLTRLWEEDSFSTDKDANTQTIIDRVGRYFTLTVLAISLATFLYWSIVDPSLSFNSFTAVLIVACPCALALAIPFTYGNILRILGKKFFFMKSVRTIERIQSATHIVFDKTGTITDHKTMELIPVVENLTPSERVILYTIVSQSNHPVSRAIAHFLGNSGLVALDYFEEYPGKGIQAGTKEHSVKLGSPLFITGKQDQTHQKSVMVEIDGKVKAIFNTVNKIREGVPELIDSLAKNYKLSVISGDNEKEMSRLKAVFPAGSTLLFNQSPADKLQYIKILQAAGEKVIMIGDGLNDAGALRQSDAGIVISDDNNNFTPACDAIINARVFDRLLFYLTYLKKAEYLIWGAFVLAFFYNTAGLYFAVRAMLSPIIAAVLMPLSSVTVMVYGVISGYLLFKKMNSDFKHLNTRPIHLQKEDMKTNLNPFNV
ncbi:MAG: heavy metal translocating P-type ATPase metal-binding domain-containing protein [Saprospiraceae bacterium]|nr:heavy metal translocating P-type ATPase metal-binding domain-containing protein [Saprospiraceae bacterium]